jgi:hypothetical protein
MSMFFSCSSFSLAFLEAVGTHIYTYELEYVCIFLIFLCPLENTLGTKVIWTKPKNAAFRTALRTSKPVLKCY